MFEKLMDLEVKANSVNAVVEEADVKSCQSMAIIDKLRCEAASESEPQGIATSSDIEDLQHIVSTVAPGDALPAGSVEAQSASVAEPKDRVDKVGANDQKFLMSLRGTRKEDAVLNLLLNRSCRCDQVQAVLDDMEKNFQSDVPKLTVCHRD